MTGSDISSSGRGYNEGDIVMLTDDSSNYMEMPTKANIVSSPRSCYRFELDGTYVLIDARNRMARKGSKPERLAFLPLYVDSILPENALVSYVLSVDSGHGGQTADQDGDEADGYDEGE